MNPQHHDRIGRFIALVGVSGVVLFSAGCGEASEAISESVTEKIAEESAGGNVDIDMDTDAGTYSIESDEGSLSFGQKLPDGWPTDIELPADFVVTGGTDLSSGTERMVNVAGTTELSMDEVIAFYTNELSGWTEVSKSEFTADRRTVNVSFQDGGRMIIVGGVDGTPTEWTISYTESEA